MWWTISWHLGVGRHSRTQPAHYQGTNISAARMPLQGQLRVARGVSAIKPESKSYRITLRVENTSQETAVGLIVWDTVPDGFSYCWNSLRADPARTGLTVEGSNPYRFKIGDLSAHESVELIYQIVAVTAG